MPADVDRDAALRAVLAELAELSLDPEEVLRVVARRCAELVGDGCVIRFLSEDGARLVLGAAHHVDPEANALIHALHALAEPPASAGLSGVAVRTGEAQHAEAPAGGDLTSRHYAAYGHRFGVRSLLVAPVRSRGRVIGVLAATRDRASAPYTDDDRAFLLRLIDGAALLFENARLFALGREAEERFRRIFEEAPVGCAIIGARGPERGRYLRVNAALCRILGRDAGELAGTHFADVTHPDDRAQDARVFAELHDGRRTSAVRRKRYVRPDGTIAWVSVSVSPTGRGDQLIVQAVDISEQVAALERVTFQSELLDQVDAAVVAMDLDGIVLVWNTGAERLFGWSAAEACGRPGRELFAPGEDLAGLDEPGHEAVAGGWDGEYLMARRDGTTFPAYGRSRPVRDGDGRIVGLVGVFIDLTERHRAEEALRRRVAQQEAVAALGMRALEGAQPSDLMDHATQAAAATLEVELAAVLELGEDERGLCLRAAHGFDPDVVLHESVSADWDVSQAGFTLLTGRPVLVEDVEHERRFARHALLAAHGVRSGATVVIKGRGRPYGVLAVHSVRPCAFTADDIAFVQSLANVLADAIDRWRTEEDIRRRGLHDPLTGLPNRTLVLDRITHALARAEREPGEVALLFLDLDDFKLVNDSLGHGAGDELLVALAPRLREAVRPADTVGRFGGDEFVVLCENVAGEAEALGIAARIARMFDRPFPLRGDDHVVRASIGVVLRDDSHRDAEALLRDADAAMYRAKEHGRGRVELFDTGMRARAVGRLQTEASLRRALDADELHAVYQPLVSLADGRLEGFEALVRWRHPERGLLTPAQFIPVAEQSGLIVPVGRRVLGLACERLAAWARLRPGEPHLRVHVNLSGRQISDPNCRDMVADVLEATGADPRAVVLEVTEGSLLDRAGAAGSTLHKLRALGVRISLDDFGTGYSALGYLRRFPIDGLKIDRSFLSGVEAGGEPAAIVDAILRMARALGLEAVAEGVEEHAQLVALRRLGCSFAQGFLFSPPLAAQEADALALVGALPIERDSAAER